MKYPNLIEHFEMILSSLQGELYGEAMATTATFKMRLAELEAQLSEFQNGIEIEKAKEGRKWVLGVLIGGEVVAVKHGGYCMGRNMEWQFFGQIGVVGLPDNRFEKFLTLPSTETKEGE